MKALDVAVHFELSGWVLFFAELARRHAPPEPLASLRAKVAAAVRDSLGRESLSTHPPIAALRRLFKEAGCDPTRYRPSSEALIRRVLKGEEIPEIHPLVDINNCLSAVLGVPCCVMADGTFSPPFIFRRGRAGESYESLRGPFRLEDKPVLLDGRGPCDAPITGSLRVKVNDQTERATLVAYLPDGVVESGTALHQLEELIRSAPVAALLGAASSP